MSTSRCVPIYEVIEYDREPELNQRFFARASTAESYADQLRKEGLNPVTHKHFIELNRDGLCHLANTLVKK